MEIEDLRKDTDSFNKLSIGCVFIYNGKTCIRSWNVIVDGQPFNATILSSNAGTMIHLDPTDKVEWVNAKIVIES